MKNLVKYAFLLFSFLLICCGAAPYKEYARAGFVIGTLCQIRIYTKLPKKEAEKTLDSIFTRLQKLEEILSANAENSELMLVNTHAGIKPITVSHELISLLQTAVFFAEKTNGAFDPAIGAIVKLWNIGFDTANVPADDEIKNRLSLANYKNIEFNKNTVFLKESGMMLDLGAIAKGFAADEIIKILKQRDINTAIIDLGGNIFALGEKSKGEPWKVGLRNPHLHNEFPVVSAEVRDTSVVTSGSYERFFEKNGVRYHHIIDPKTGYPVKTNLVSVSIFAKNSTDADALSTACFVLGYKKSIELLKDFPEVEAVFIFDDDTIKTTTGLKGKIGILNKTFKLTD
ncbi:FAD:protein FMN transferase [Treponema phagedenis]|uniref:FAD:protein FMN transferase n=1 Tax=Treponema phagedenis TaxID=162 RepID=UPI0011E735F3|nr:FAD:protein FMN transferase [Treponema phagedenis]QEK01854.1 FAD:protein FMN transferase [Treponema phagedenis]QEK06967.1 FAD:protein FMN transferase [Treponema phagedenis]QSH94420.1 FAD:protein FMN transferase [Treponema phagedenis]